LDTVRVTAGRMNISVQHSGSVDTCYPPYVPINVSRQVTNHRRILRAYSVEGTAQALSPAGGVTVCDWSVATATAVGDYRNASSFVGGGNPEVRLDAVVHRGFNADPGCGLTDGRQLPNRLLPCLPGDSAPCTAGGDYAGMVAYPSAPFGFNDWPTDVGVGGLWYGGPGLMVSDVGNASTYAFITTVYGFDIDCEKAKSSYQRSYDIPFLLPGEPFQLSAP